MKNNIKLLLLLIFLVSLTSFNGLFDHYRRYDLITDTDSCIIYHAKNLNIDIKDKFFESKKSYDAYLQWEIVDKFKEFRYE